MYKWKIEYILKNGERLHGEYFGNERDSAGVIKTLLQGDLNTFNGCKNLKGTGTMCVRNGEIAALIVST